MFDSVFYILIEDALATGCKRLCDFTDLLDGNRVEKNERIAEYKCAKYRYASVLEIHTAIYHNNRCRTLYNMKDFHYLLLPYDELFKKNPEFIKLYDCAPESEKPDVSLYYSMIAFISEEIEKLEGKSLGANDWETIELNERIGGFRFAKACLDEAWQKRKDVNEWSKNLNY